MLVRLFLVQSNEMREELKEREDVWFWMLEAKVMREGGHGH